MPQAVLGAALQAKGSGLQVLCVEPHPLRYSALVELREHFFTGSVPGMRWCACLPACLLLRRRHAHPMAVLLRRPPCCTAVCPSLSQPAAPTRVPAGA